MFPELPDARIEIRKPIASPSAPTHPGPIRCAPAHRAATLTAPNFPNHRRASNRGQRRNSENVENASRGATINRLPASISNPIPSITTLTRHSNSPKIQRLFVTDGDPMRLTVIAIFTAIPLLAATMPRSQSLSQKDVEAYIKNSESQWTDMETTGDTSVAERILANDFVGVRPDGSHYAKAQEIAESKAGQIDYSKSHLAEINVRFYGDAAVAQGRSEWEKRNGQSGSFIFTDTWIYRDNKWQIVAAEDVKIQQPSK
jgi:hypothetical protein